MSVESVDLLCNCITMVSGEGELVDPRTLIYWVIKGCTSSPNTWSIFNQGLNVRIFTSALINNWWVIPCKSYFVRFTWLPMS